MSCLVISVRSQTNALFSFTCVFAYPGKLPLLTVKQAASALKKLNNWFMFGLGLGVPVSELRKIESASGSEHVEQCKAETIQYWLDNNPDASWMKIAQALELVDELVLAAEVKWMYLWEGIHVA